MSTDASGPLLTLVSARWTSPRTVEIEGRAGAGVTVEELVVVDGDGIVVTRVGVDRGAEDAFTARLDLEPLVPAAGGGRRRARWAVSRPARRRRPVPTASRARVEVRALVDGETVVAPWNDRPAGGASRRLGTAGACDGWLVRLSWEESGLEVAAEPVVAVLGHQAVDEGGLALSIDAVETADDGLRYGGSGGEVVPCPRTRGGAWLVRLDEARAEDADLVVSSGGRRWPVGWGPAPGEAVGDPATGVRTVRRRNGRVGVTRAPAAVVEDVHVSDDAVVLEGTAWGLAPGGARVVARGPRRVAEVSVHARGARFTAAVPLAVTGWYGEDSVLPSGRYELAWVSGALEVPVVCEPTGHPDLPLVVGGAPCRTEVVATSGNRLAVVTSPPLRPDERGPAAQERLRRRYDETPSAPARMAYFECYYGASATDSARAIHDELLARGTGVDLVWGLADLSVPVPEGGRGVLIGSREWWDVVAHARYLTFNAGVPPMLRRRPGQTIVQTWHGTPFKRLGSDRGTVRADQERFLPALKRSVARWDVLLAGNPHSAEVFGRVWGYEGEILQLGYPRNDALARADDGARREARARLGLPADAHVVLYAPTWRDRQRLMPQLLDVERVADALGPGGVVLQRGHMNVRRWESASSHARVRDVTDYPEINDLFLAADVAITDYSSIMFDFSVTGRPLVFYAPDLDDYRDRRRGTYFDLEECAPGPVVSTTDEVVEVLRDLEGTATRYAERYRTWCETYNPLDDGRAAERVVDAVYRDV